MANGLNVDQSLYLHAYFVYVSSDKSGQSTHLVVLLLLICCLLLQLFMGICAWSLFCCAMLDVLSNFAIILFRRRELVALL